MANRAEQIGRDRRYVNDNWKFIKRMTSKKRRAEEKRDPENAPKRPKYDGYAA